MIADHPREDGVKVGGNEEEGHQDTYLNTAGLTNFLIEGFLKIKIKTIIRAVPL